MLNVFVSGLTKQSGKTIVTAGLAGTMQSLNYSTCVYKPIQTNANSLNGFLQSQDLALIKRIDANISTASSYIFTSQNSPIVAAYEAESKKIELNKIYNDFQTAIQSTECNIVEGSNSIATPISDKTTELDVVRTLDIPLLLVLNPKKSKIEDAITGINFVISSGVKLLGVIINEYDDNSGNIEEKYYPEMVKEFTGVKLLGKLPSYERYENLTADTLIADILHNIKIQEVFGLQIAKLN